MTDRNAMGDRGEYICAAIINTFHGDQPIFRPVLLGGKWPVADLAVELADEPGMFFLVQIKSTATKFAETAKFLQISAKREALQALADAPLPTYLVGVHEPTEQAFLSAVYGTVRGQSSISVEHSLREPEVRTRLYAEVKGFWEAVRASCPWSTTHFLNEGEEDAVDGHG